MKFSWPDNPVVALGAKLGIGAVGMFVFAIWIMPPLYNAFCQITGFNGKTGGPYKAAESGVDTSRTVKVQFVATNNESMPWAFKPQVTSLKVHPGEQNLIKYWARNPTDKDMVGQAIPSMVPSNASTYFHKVECFCFNQQSLAGGEEAELPMTFIVDKDIPKNIGTITLSYTLFDVTERFSEQQGDLASAQ